MFFKVTRKVIRKIIWVYKRYILKDKFLSAYDLWIKAQGDETLRLNYNLNEDSIVFDLGGFHGDFAESIYDKYQSTIYIFEPVEEFYNIIKNKFKNNNKIKIFHFGLSDKNDKLEITLSDNGTSIYLDGLNKETIELKSITDFFIEENIQKIDLFKINIEGGEFDILPLLIKSNMVLKIDNLQIQFHNFIFNAEEKRKDIIKGLSTTHKLTYSYWFIWENWKIKDNH
jgi:FkbM family methyltransferase